MDDFVRGKLNEWDLNELMEKFEEEGIGSRHLYSLEDAEISELIPKIGTRAVFKKELKLLKAKQKDEETTNMTEVLPSTSDTGKRKPDPQWESRKGQPAVKRKCETNSSAEKEATILSKVKNTMGSILAMLQDDTDLNKFLKTKIRNLETEKKELVGVFGKTGAGKTSLINAVIDEENLLPSGSVKACTSVMIKVEANRDNENYEAKIEFISQEEWEDELRSMIRLIEKRDREKDDDEDEDYHDAVAKLSAVYHEDWNDKSWEQLMDSKNFKEVKDCLRSKQKTLAFESAKDLSADIIRYTRTETKPGKVKEREQWYWPLVKCVTIRVPKHPLLQHVTLVDLPGNGDSNKSRNTMWKWIVGDCSTVWVVTDTDRAAANAESWEILKSVSSLIGNGGEGRHLHFICTKSDIINNLDELSKAEAQDLILQRNMEAKESVCEKLNKLTKIKEHFTGECFQVFTVSSTEFFREKHLTSENTEIPRLQEFLKNLNDCHSETLNYVSGAHGILSLIHGASRRKEDSRIKEVCEALEKNLSNQIESVRQEMMKIQETFEVRLQEGVEKSKSSCEKNLEYTLYPKNRDGRGFHKQLKKAVENGGICKPKKGKEININMELTSPLADSIDEDFRKTFPNEGKCGPFNGVINKFSLDTEKLKQKYGDVKLQLVFLKSEEEHLKTDLNKSIRKRKKKIYRTLTKTVEETMQDCYNKAASISGTGTLQNMRETIETYVHESKNTMFENAKNVMMNELSNLMEEVLKRLENTMRESIELSLKTDDHSIPDVSEQLEMVNKFHEELKSN